MSTSRLACVLGQRIAQEAHVSTLHPDFREACVQGDIEIVKRFLASGADINARDHFEQTPLHHAAQWHNIDLCELLIKACAEIDPKDKWGDTPLYRAVVGAGTKEEMSTAAYLVTEGADIESKNVSKATPLKVAMEQSVGDILLDARKCYEAKQSKHELLDGLGARWKPSDC